MKYISKEKSHQIDKALGLTEKEVERLRGVISDAYKSAGSQTQPLTVDELNAYCAPHINTPEEAYFVASVILSDVFGTMIHVLRQNQLKPAGIVKPIAEA